MMSKSRTNLSYLKKGTKIPEELLDINTRIDLELTDMTKNKVVTDICRVNYNEYVEDVNTEIRSKLEELAKSIGLYENFNHIFKVNIPQPKTDAQNTVVKLSLDTKYLTEQIAYHVSEYVTLSDNSDWSISIHLSNNSSITSYKLKQSVLRNKLMMVFTRNGLDCTFRQGAIRFAHSDKLAVYLDQFGIRIGKTSQLTKSIKPTSTLLDICEYLKGIE